VLSHGVVVLAALAWLGVLFAVAVYAERRPQALARHWPVVYALSLAVYCTSWTFYGTVTQAARYGWPLPPTFIGTILLYLFAAGAIVRLVRMAHESNATSLADLIASRLGKDSRVAASVTAIAALGLVPYIALQLKAVAMSYAMVTGGDPAALQPVWRDGALYVALAMALFAMAFGARSASATAHNRGLVLAIAFESLFKLVAMLALGAFVVFGLQLPDAPAPAPPQTPADGFMPLVILGVLAMFVLPHQFHVGVVECRDPGHVRTARWLFPAYMLAIALPLLPLAHAGTVLLGGTGLSSDLYVLALPLSQGQQGLALFGFLGGVSAATSMVVVATLTLGVMIGNHWLTPGLLRGAWRRDAGADLRASVLRQRRAAIVAIMLLAWGYNRLIAGNSALADVGAVSFSALATLAPALAFAVWRPETPPRAVVAGLAAGFAVWSWALLVPLLLQAAALAPGWLQAGPFGLSLLAPDALFGLTGWSRLGRAVGASLVAGTLATFAVALWWPGRRHAPAEGFDARTLRNAGRRFLPARRLAELLDEAPDTGPVPPRLQARVERELAAVLGSASARLLLDAARREVGADLETVATIVDEAREDLRFNQRLLEAALENMSQGISVVDARLRLVAWNRRYAELFGFPDGLLQVGRPVADLARWALARLQTGGEVEQALQRRMAFMRAGTAHLSERVMPVPGGGDAIIEIRGNPMPGGGFVATFTDVTAFRRTEAALLQSKQTLEQRVAERTGLLEQAKREAEQANEAKSRFLAAIGHDLMQPLHAAQLFADALAEQLRGSPQAHAVAEVRGALDSTSDLLGALLDMSRLEAGGLVPEPRPLPLAEVLDPLVSEFGALAAANGVRLRWVPSAAWVRTDPQLLRRVLQNFLANALRHAGDGEVLVGARREGTGLRIEVHDTGPGIAAEEQARVFEEFRRGPGAAGQGLGLGLAIARRICDLLDAPLGLRSAPGRGSVFSVRVPRAAPLARPATEAAVSSAGLSGLEVLVVDNAEPARAALAALLSAWGCRVRTAADGAGAERLLQAHPAGLWLLDYHLDDGDTGVALQARLRARFGAAACVVLSADRSAAVREAVAAAGLALLLKPLRPLALKSVLDRVLRGRVQSPA
jgi:Na+/proline symporter/C4-dicarboxylate-specific signal transduction histidine kinase